MRDHKIVILGSGGVGKSAITMQFVSGIFIESYDPTIEDVYVKKLTLGDDRTERVVEILDTAGIEQFSSLRDLYIKNADGLLIVFSITNETSFKDIIPLREHILRVTAGRNKPLLLVGNKVDIAHSQRQVSRSRGEKLALDWGCSFFETSAKRNVAVQDSFMRLLDAISLEQTIQKKPNIYNEYCCLVQ